MPSYRILSVNLVENFSLLKAACDREVYDFIIISEPKSFHFLRSFSILYHDPIYNEPNGDVMMLINRRYTVDLRKTLASRNQLIVGLQGGLRVIGVHMSVSNNDGVIDWLSEFVHGNTIMAGDFNNTLDRLKKERTDLQFTDQVTTRNGSRIDNIVLPVTWKGKYRVTEGGDHHLLEWIGDDDECKKVEGKKEDKKKVVEVGEEVKKEKEEVKKEKEEKPVISQTSWYMAKPGLKAHLPGCRHLAGKDESTWIHAVKGESKCGLCLRRKKK